ncbi:MAG: hypothetical protein RLZZ175_3090 [Bacteroidota bacterium]|jgi:hypothetical protein
MKIKYMIISLLVLLTGLFYACKKTTSEEIASPIATCEFTVKGHYNDTIMPNSILYFYDSEAKYEASKSSISGDLNAVLIDTTDANGKLTVDLSANKKYWVRVISKAVFKRFNDLPYFFNNDNLGNSTLELLADKKQKAFYTLKVDNENPFSLLVVYCSDANLINAKVQLKNKSTNKVVSKTFGNKLNDTISQVSAIQPPLKSTLGDEKNCIFYLVKKGEFTIKSLSTNGLITSQDVSIDGEGKIYYFDLRGKEIAKINDGIKLTFYSFNTNKNAFPYKIYINGDTIGYLTENSIPTAGVPCSNPNSPKVFTVIIPKAVSNGYNYSFAFQSSLSSSAPMNAVLNIPSNTSCFSYEIK